MDDTFGFGDSADLALYGPYNRFFPSAQVMLLQFWDQIGLLHEVAKQEFGHSLVITSFLVDPMLMTISLNAD